jgi:hypothetical protein
VFRDVVIQHPQALLQDCAPVIAPVDEPVARDQGYGTPESIGEPISSADDNVTSSWQAFRDGAIPDAVRTVSFTINGPNMSVELREQLQERFPGVELTCVPDESEGMAPGSFEDNEQADCGAGSSLGTQTVERVSIPKQERTIRALEPRTPEQTKIATTPDAELDGPSNAPRKLAIETPPKSDQQELLNDDSASKLDNPGDSLPDNQTISQGSQYLHDVSTSSALQDELAGIKLELTTKGNLRKMLKQWQDKGELKSWAARSAGNVQQYYSNMIRLYVLDHHEAISPLPPHIISLKSAILLQFQMTAYQHGGDLLTLMSAVYAMKWLPYDAPLCQWIVIQFAFLWGTQDDPIGFKQLPKVYPEFERMAFTDTKALMNLLYGTAFVRDPHTRGHDAAVLARWCEVHDHAKNPGEKELCDKMQPRVQQCLKEAEKEQERHRLEDAIAELNKHNSIAAMEDRLKELRKEASIKKDNPKAEGSTARAAKKPKRKADDSPPRPARKNKKMRSRGVSE